MTAPPRGPKPATVMRLALGVVYLHFGFLKLFPDLSPAEMLASQTVIHMGLPWSAETALLFVAVLECVVGVFMLLGVFRRLTLGLFLLHLAGTFAPLFVLPELAFKYAPFAPTFEGQYVLKNFVYVAAAWGLWCDIRAEAAERGEAERQSLGAVGGADRRLLREVVA